MPLTNKPLNSIDELDLQALVNDQVREGRTIEYKQVLLAPPSKGAHAWKRLA